MSIEVSPLGVTCNLRCDYCYEESTRDVKPVYKYNKQAVIDGIKRARGSWHLFGGEPLLLPLNELEELLKLSYEQWNTSNIQTNGSLITSKHIDLFFKYRTQVGISIDGPDELNDARWAGTLKATRKATLKSEKAIYKILKLAEEKNDRHIGPTLIVTLHAGNVGEQYWPKMRDWILKLDALGLKFINFHWMENDSLGQKWELTDDQLIVVMRNLYNLMPQLSNIKFLNFQELEFLLRGIDKDVMCVWRGCDPWSTASVQALNNEGRASNCLRGTKEGIDWVPAEGHGNFQVPWGIGPEFMTMRSFERQLSLYVTPEENGGCKGCRFWMMCQGYCPGSGLRDVQKNTGDWRLKSTHCGIIKSQFIEAESRLVAMGETPISLHGDRDQIEKILYNYWSNGLECSMSDALKEHLQNIMPHSNYRPLQEMHTDIIKYDDHTDDVPHGDHYDGI